MPADDPATCPCGKPYTLRQVLCGWRPCRADRGGCGHTRHQPELSDDCRDVPIR